MNFRIAFVCSVWSILAGCAASGPQCSTATVMDVYPSAATADSATKAPANQQAFQASVGVQVVQEGSGSCPIPAIRAAVHPVWTNPDADHLTISSADDATNGLATCTGPTAGVVTLTATLPAGAAPLGANSAPLTTTARLTCK